MCCANAAGEQNYKTLLDAQLQAHQVSQLSGHILYFFSMVHHGIVSITRLS